MEEKEEEKYPHENIVNEALNPEWRKGEPPTLMQYLRSLRNHQFLTDERDRIFGRGPIIRDPETNEAYTNPLKLVGDTLDTINDQISLKKISPMLQFLPEDNTPEKLKDVADYSLKDFQYDAMDFVGEKARESINTGIPNLDKILVGGAVLGTAFAVPDATDFLTGGVPVADTVRVARKLTPKRIGEIIDDIGSVSPFSKQVVTPEGWEMPTYFMSKTDGIGGFSKNIKKTSDEYEKLVLSGMERMGMKDGVLDMDLYNKNSPILNEMSDPLGGTVMKSGMRRGRKLTKRNWMEYFLSPESLKGNFESLRKSGKVSADLEWGDFLKSKGLKIQDIQAHHINPLYDSMHLFDGVKWGSDEYWDVVSTLINRGARPGVVQRGDTVTNIVRTFGKSSLEDTPHGIAHAFYRDIMPVFFSKKEVNAMKGSHKIRMEKTKRWAGIVRRSEEILIESHKAWEALNPKTRMDFNELVENMSKYDNKGIIKGIHEKYQVKDIKKMVSEINEMMILEPLPTRKFKNVNEVKQRMMLYKAKPGVTWKMVKKKFPGFNYEQLDLFD